MSSYEEDKGSQLHNSPTASLFEAPVRSHKVYKSHSKSDQQNHQDIDDIFMDNIVPTIDLIRMKEYLNVSKIADRDHLTNENWHKWKDHMKWVFNNCNISGYVTGMVKRPNKDNNIAGAHNWDKNNSWVQQVIICNVTSSQMNHVRLKSTAEAMYLALTITDENKAHQTVNHIQCLLYEMKACEGDNLLKHLDTLKSYWDHINKFPNADFHVLDT